MILCVGEILADMVGSVRDETVFYERKAGGAPFNVACASVQFGAKASFVGSVGDDLIGRFLDDYAHHRGLENCLIRVDSCRNTTLAFVELNESGDRSFCFYRHGTADYYLPEIPEAMFAEASIVHIGSLMLSTAEGLAYAKALTNTAHRYGIPVSFDVNYRSDIFRDEATAVATYRQLLALVDIVKFSDDEVRIFTEEYLQSDLREKLIFVTLGKNGAEWRYRGKSHRLPTIDLKPVDTTGAGDAFYAGVLSRLDGKPLATLTDEVLDEALRFGNVTGALNTLGHGAIDCLPTLPEIENALKFYR